MRQVGHTLKSQDCPSEDSGRTAAGLCSILSRSPSLFQLEYRGSARVSGHDSHALEHSTIKKIGFASYQLALLLASLPQHSGRCGRLDLSHPPPRACISNTVLAIRRPKILTAVTSSESAALWAVMTSR
jgi:hypothetical protein